MYADMDMKNQFQVERKVICVQGLGFVGSAMALAVASARDEAGSPRYNVIGIDLPSDAGRKRINSINEGVFPFTCNDKKLEEAQRLAQQTGNFRAVTDPAYFQYADVVIVDINLDIMHAEELEPSLDMTPFEAAIRTIGRYIKPEALVIVETTVPPGTCEKIVYPCLKEELKKRGLEKKRIFVAHSYERVMPGENYFDSIINYWRVYSGIDETSADKCQRFLESVIKTDQYPLTRLQRTTASEVAKVLENSYRAVTIALMEEWGRFAEAIGVDLYEVIDAIRLRPTHSNMRQPGFGVGGYCLTKDPYFAALAAKDIFGLEYLDFPFSTQAVTVNHVMPLVSLDKVEHLLGDCLRGKKILVLGVSYRQDVGDTRHSPTELFVREGRRRGAEIACQDPMVAHWDEMDMDVLHEIPPFEGYDAIVFTVPHKQYQMFAFHEDQFSKDTVVFDANRVLSDQQRKALSGFKFVTLSCIGR